MTYEFSNPTYTRHACYLKQILEQDYSKPHIDRYLHINGERKSGIYVILNTKTGDYYIGSSKDIHERVLNHTRSMKGKVKGGNILCQRHAQKYGLEAFKFLVIHSNIPFEHLELAEDFWIKELEPFYNLNRRARRPVVTERMKQMVGYAAKYTRDNTQYNVPILQYDLNFNFIKEWPSIKIAKESTGSTHISLACRHKNKDGSKKVVAGSYWEYKNEPTPTRASRDVVKKVVQVCHKTGVNIKVWESKKHVAEHFNIQVDTISKAISKKRITSGYKWNYL